MFLVNKCTCIIMLVPGIEQLFFYTLILNRYVMEKVDMVLVGAEGVVESGGIINKVINSNL